MWKENNRLVLKQNPAIFCLQVNFPPSSVPSHLVNPPKAILLPVSHILLGSLFLGMCVCARMRALMHAPMYVYVPGYVCFKKFK